MHFQLNSCIISTQILAILIPDSDRKMCATDRHVLKEHTESVIISQCIFVFSILRLLGYIEETCIGASILAARKAKLMLCFSLAAGGDVFTIQSRAIGLGFALF